MLTARHAIPAGLTAIALASVGAGLALPAGGSEPASSRPPTVERYERDCWFDLYTTRRVSCGAAPVSTPVLVAGMGHPLLES
jgi:hypothetical protein